MNAREWRTRERKREWMRRLQITAGACILTAVFFLYVSILFALDALIHL